MNDLNGMCGSTFESWDAVSDAVASPGEIPLDLKKFRIEILRLYPTLTLVCETPNLIYVPLAYPIAAGADESEANRALRRLFVALLIYRAFGTSVAIHSEPDDIDLQNRSGVAWVPPAPAIRSLLGTDWISPDSAGLWLDRIGAAARLASAAGYPARSAIYQTLTADPAEIVLRRIETQRHMVSLEQTELICKLPFFRTAALYKEVHS